MTEHTFKVSGKTYKLRDLTWEEDLDIQQKCTNPDGTLNTRELMIIRIAKSFIEPKLLTDEVRNLPMREGNILSALWIKVNDVDPSIFLEVPTQSSQNTDS